MPATRIDLYRSGNAGSALMERVRTGGPTPDVETFSSGAVEWVRANTGGVSTYDAPDPAWRGRVWRLPAGARFTSKLVVVTDAPGHWIWQPAHDMPLAEYMDALESVNVLFVRN